MTTAIAIGALFASLAPVYAMWMTFRQNAATSYEAQLERRVEKLEHDLEACRKRVGELEEENLRLMRKLTS